MFASLASETDRTFCNYSAHQDNKTWLIAFWKCNYILLYRDTVTNFIDMFGLTYDLKIYKQKYLLSGLIYLCKRKQRYLYLTLWLIRSDYNMIHSSINQSKTNQCVNIIYSSFDRKPITDDDIVSYCRQNII